MFSSPLPRKADDNASATASSDLEVTATSSDADRPTRSPLVGQEKLADVAQQASAGEDDVDGPCSLLPDKRQEAVSSEPAPALVSSADFALGTVLTPSPAPVVVPSSDKPDDRPVEDQNRSKAGASATVEEVVESLPAGKRDGFDRRSEEDGRPRAN